MPADSHSYDVTVAASDTDINGHTNHTSYVRYCCDAAQVMVKAGTLQGFQVDIAKYPVLVSAHHCVSMCQCTRGCVSVCVLCVCVCECMYQCMCQCACVCQ